MWGRLPVYQISCLELPGTSQTRHTQSSLCTPIRLWRTGTRALFYKALRMTTWACTMAGTVQTVEGCSDQEAVHYDRLVSHGADLAEAHSRVSCDHKTSCCHKSVDRTKQIQRFLRLSLRHIMYIIWILNILVLILCMYICAEYKLLHFMHICVKYKLLHFHAFSFLQHVYCAWFCKTALQIWKWFNKLCSV